MSRMLDQQELRDAFGRMAVHLRRRGVVGHIYVVGGAAMALAYDAERITRDADALIVEAHGPVTEAAAAVADEMDLPRSWLNEQATAYIPAQHDAAASVVFDHPNLKVSAASPSFVLAMKARAARPRDMEDITRLALVLGVTTVDEVITIHDLVFGDDDPLPTPAAQRLRTYWDQPS